ncbi:hypothetical protein [Photobacterium leiognathi]|uniref:hypothetical protein n=1 Tax=Photobacterium leiognathi TaxID=553611 RepID=UPI002981FBE8|nr:hypothetical protein [Photobacterium leiognathi]
MNRIDELKKRIEAHINNGDGTTDERIQAYQAEKKKQEAIDKECRQLDKKPAFNAYRKKKPARKRSNSQLYVGYAMADRAANQQ